NLVDGNPSSHATRALEVGGRALFLADDGIHGREVWRSDGVRGTTVLVKDTVPGRGSPVPFDPWFDAVTALAGGRLYFAGSAPGSGQELWTSDGTPAGTRLVKDIWPGADGSWPTIGASLDGILYFAAYDPDHGEELWRTDGTRSGTWLVKDLRPGP